MWALPGPLHCILPDELSPPGFYNMVGVCAMPNVLEVIDACISSFSAYSEFRARLPA